MRHFPSVAKALSAFCSLICVTKKSLRRGPIMGNFARHCEQVKETADRATARRRRWRLISSRCG
jgi:1-acyl-sn-glycerol-3-phosphate acyltransferase